MKNLSILLLLVFLSYTGIAQLTLTDGSVFSTSVGSSMIVKGDLNSDNASFENNGTLIIEGDLVNNSAALFSPVSTGIFTFGGSSAQEITGDADVDFYGYTVIDNAAGVALTDTETGSDQTINGELQFVNGLLSLNDFNLNIGVVDPTGQDSDGYVQTNGLGELKREIPADGSTNVLFPIGNSAYNPIQLKSEASAATDTYGLLVMDYEPANASTSDFVDRSWVVSEDVDGGSLLTVTPQWNETEELTGFGRDFAAVGLTNDDGSTYIRTSFNAATGTDPYTLEGATFNDIGTFAVSSIVPCDYMTVYFVNNFGQYNEGGILEYREGGGNPWQVATEVTDGVFCVDSERTKVGLRINYGPQQKKYGGVYTSSDFTFESQLVTVELRNNGVLGTDGGNVEYSANGYYTFGTTGDDGLGIVHRQMLPAQYHFRMEYLGLTEDIIEVISASNNVVTFDENDLNSGGINGAKERELAVYPNPFNGLTTVAFGLEEDKEVSLAIYDMKGQLVKFLHQGLLEKGNQKMNWDASELQKGVYVVRFTSADKIYHLNVVKM